MPKTTKLIMFSYLAMVVANLIWAAAGPVIKMTLDFLPPFTFLFFRFLIVCVLLLPYTIYEISKNPIHKSDIWKIALLGLTGQSSLAFIFLGLKYTTAVDSAIIGSIAVLMSMAAGHYFFNEKSNKGVVYGLFLALIGTFVVILEPLLSNGHSTSQIPVLDRVYGNVLVFINNMAFLLYIIWSKISFGETSKLIKKTLSAIHITPMKKRYPDLLLLSISFYVGLITMIPMAFLENLDFFGPVPYNITDIGAKGIAGLLYMALLSSMVAYFLFEWSLNIVSVGDTAILGYISSIFGIPFAFLLLGEVPSFFALVGTVIIAIGVAFAEIGQHQQLLKEVWYKRLWHRIFG